MCDDLSSTYDAANINISSARLTAGLKRYLRLSETSNVATGARAGARARACKYIKLLRMYLCLFIQ